MPKPEKRRIGRPFKWPWMDTKVGGSFVLTALTIESARSAVSRAARLWGVRYTINSHPDKRKYRLRRTA
jgi:hypothetical protein